MGALSIGHWLVVLFIVVLLFGVKRLPELGQSLGEGIRNFKKGLAEPPKPEELPESRRDSEK
jgi:sec-independent protein translocase protein TatA